VSASGHVRMCVGDAAPSIRWQCSFVQVAFELVQAGWCASEGFDQPQQLRRGEQSLPVDKPVYACAVACCRLRSPRYKQNFV
jgi:hypothetical protein